MMPQQKPGKSKQDWQTPPELLHAIKNRLCIVDFDVDVAATKENTVCPYFLDQTGLISSWQVEEPTSNWAWCNPPYGDIGPWVDKAIDESMTGAYVAMLVPMSLAKWWLRAKKYAYILYLVGRITFVGASAPYPKDCALLLFTPMRLTGSQEWDWRS